MGNSKVFKSIFSVTGVLIFAKVIGFVKQMVTASVFGATIETDLINISQEFILNIEYILIHTITTAFVAVFIKIHIENEEDGDRLLSDSLKVATIVVASIILISELLSPVISRVLAPSYSDELSITLSNYIRIYLPALLLFIITSIFNGLLNANNHFVPGQLSGLFLSVITIVCVLAFKNSLGVNSLVVGFISYAVFNFVFIASLSSKYYHYRKGNPFKNPNIKHLFLMMAPLFWGYSMIFANQQVDKIIVSGMEAGTVTAMGYAAVLSNLVTTLTGAACTVLFTHMTVQSSEGAHDKAANIAYKSSIILISILIPISIISIFDATDIVHLAFGRGSFDSIAVRNAGYALMGYSFSFIPFALKDLYARFLYGRQNTKSPMINTSIGIVFNIILSILLSRRFGVFGVTIASSFSELVACILNMRSSKKQSVYIDFGMMKSFIPYWILGGVLCFLGVKLGLSVFDSYNVLVKFVLVTLLGIIGYFLGVLRLFIRYKSIIKAILLKNN